MFYCSGGSSGVNINPESAMSSDMNVLLFIYCLKCLNYTIGHYSHASQDNAMPPALFGPVLIRDITEISGGLAPP